MAERVGMVSGEEGGEGGSVFSEGGHLPDSRSGQRRPAAADFPPRACVYPCITAAGAFGNGLHNIGNVARHVPEQLPAKFRVVRPVFYCDFITYFNLFSF